MDTNQPTIPETNDITPATAGKEFQAPEVPMNVPPVENNPPTVPPTPKTKSKLMPILLIVLILAILGVGGVYAYKNFFAKETEATPTPISTPESTPDPTADWKTFVTKDKIVTFKYPSDWTVEQSTTSEGWGKEITTASLKNDKFELIVGVANSFMNECMEEESKQNITLSGATFVKRYFKRIVLEGNEACSNSNYLGNLEIWLAPTIINKEPYNYQYGLLFYYNSTNKSEGEILFDQILSTFKFNETDSITADWKTYTNNSVGYSVKYPSDWRVESANPNLVGFVPTSVGEDVAWTVNIITNKTIDEIAADMGKQFGTDRNEKRATVTVDGVKATEITVTTTTIPNWVFKQVVVPNGNQFITLSNGAIDDSRFNDFVQSFTIK